METPRIIACMSLPRVGWNDAWGSVHSALMPWSIPILNHSSVFWAEGLSRVFQMAMDEGADWLLAIDYDSLFTRRNVAMLIEAMKLNPALDAIATLQARREHHTPLGSVKDESCTGRLLKAESAHFGLTMLRVDALRRIEKPWLMNIPNKEGEWGDGRCDADLWFWNQWRKAGNTVAIDMQNRIGHLEVVCVDFVDAIEGSKVGLQARFSAPHQWRKERQDEIDVSQLKLAEVAA